MKIPCAWSEFCFAQKEWKSLEKGEKLYKSEILLLCEWIFTTFVVKCVFLEWNFHNSFYFFFLVKKLTLKRAYWVTHIHSFHSKNNISLSGVEFSLNSFYLFVCLFVKKLTLKRAYWVTHPKKGKFHSRKSDISLKKVNIHSNKSE